MLVNPVSEEGALLKNDQEVTGEKDDRKKCGPSCAEYHGLCPCAKSLAAQAVDERIRKLLSDSVLFPKKPEFKYLTRDDVVIGKLLGEGSFAIVKNCRLKTEQSNEQSYAIKYLKPTVMVNKAKFRHAAGDLTNEAFFLATLDHPGIIKLIALSNEDVSSNFKAGKQECCFLILERLGENLEQKIEFWRREDFERTKSYSLLKRMSKETKGEQMKGLAERLAIALEIVEVMKYLHERNIVFRDLKPENLGFDSKGKLKLFDFGLSKEIKECDAISNGTYKMTGETGSPRYMAPEGTNQSVKHW